MIDIPAWMLRAAAEASDRNSDQARRSLTRDSATLEAHRADARERERERRKDPVYVEARNACSRVRNQVFKASGDRDKANIEARVAYREVMERHGRLLPRKRPKRRGLPSLDSMVS